MGGGRGYLKGQWAVIVGFIIVIIVATFSVINVEPVEVNFLFGKNEWPLVLVILFSALLGGLIVGSVGMYKIHQQKQEIRELKKKLSEKGMDQKDKLVKPVINKKEEKVEKSEQK